jgi:hypothetical protein
MTPDNPNGGEQATTDPEVLRVVVDNEAGVAPERAVRAGYVAAREVPAVLGLQNGEGREILGQIRHGIPYHDRLGEEDVYLIAASAVARPLARGTLAPVGTTGAALRQLYDQGCRGLADVDMDELLWRILADVQSSYSLALREAAVPDATVADVTTTVQDYLANHYGSD